MLQFGLRAHDFGRDTAANLALALSRYEPASIQLALAKALSDHSGKAGSLSPGAARGIREAFAERNIAVSVLGCYINPIHPDPASREASLLKFEEHLRYARDFGCAVVGTETGSLNADCSFHPDTSGEEAFDRLTESVARLAKTAERTGAIVGIEPVAHQHAVDSVERMAELLRRVASPALGVIWDPVNLIPEAGIEGSQEAFFRDALDAFGERIVAVHLKDFCVRDGKKIGTLPAGTGDLDIPLLLRLVSERKAGIDVLLENTGPQTARSALEFARKTAASAETAT